MHEAMSVKIGGKCAVKVIKKSKVAEDKVWEELLKQELEIIQKLDHPHIVRVLDLCEDEENYYIAQELIKNGNLFEVLQKMKEKDVKFSEREIADILYQILLAINYIHNSKLMHRDLKLENIMVDVQKGK